MIFIEILIYSWDMKCNQDAPGLPQFTTVNPYSCPITFLQSKLPNIIIIIVIIIIINIFI